MKQQYRDVLLSMMEFIKITKFCKQCGISQSALSWFLKGRDEVISTNKLIYLINTIRNTVIDL